MTIYKTEQNIEGVEHLAFEVPLQHGPGTRVKCCTLAFSDIEDRTTVFVSKMNLSVRPAEGVEPVDHPGYGFVEVELAHA